jgi:hypothetical protein
MARLPLAMAALLAVSAVSAFAAPPRIRADADNSVPRCVTPKRLMAFIKTRNSNLDPRFADIASYYKKHGEIWRVRWDYAFFQMAVETNFLTYRTGNGSWGDVNPKQNNFAGLGTTGGGVPGDSYPDVTTGVLAQIQHLVVYSGERIDEPVGARTRLKQDDILTTMASKKGRTTFADLARRWAADRHYGASIEWVANTFRQSFCTGRDPVEEAESKPAPPKPQKRAAPKQELARAANLGGPQPVNAPDAPAGRPVRTIWSAADGPTVPDAPRESRDEAPVEPSRGVEAAPLPSRKPRQQTEAADQIVAEQVIQTGEEPAPSAPLSEVAPAAPSLPSAEPTSAQAPPAQERVAFAFAAGMGTALAKSDPTTAATTAGGCRVGTASYGGKKALLVRSEAQTEVRYTVLTVLEGFEKSMLANYLKAHAPGGTSVGEFASKDAALAKARELCPRAAGTPKGEGASAV